VVSNFHPANSARYTYHNRVPSSSFGRSFDVVPVAEDGPGCSAKLRLPDSSGVVDPPDWHCCFDIEPVCLLEASCQVDRPDHCSSSAGCPRRRRLCDLERSSPRLPLLVSLATLGAGAALRLNDPPKEVLDHAKAVAPRLDA